MKTIKLIPVMACLAICCSKKGNNQGSATPKMTFDDITMNEGTGGTVNAELRLKLDRGSSNVVTVTYSTIEGTARGSDYTASNAQSVSFQPNETEKVIMIPVVADDIKEGDEIFQVRVQNPSNVILLKETISVTLKNDDIKVGFNNTGYDAPTSYPGYTLTWSDEFNGTSLNAADWTWEIGDGCPSLCGWGNNELEYYTQPPNNVLFQDGKMIIEARAEAYGGRNYTSARLKTQGKKTFKFGRIDIRALLPKGQGLWPALWMLPQDNVYGGWPRSGEIDIMELRGSQPSKTLGTLHYGPGPGSTYINREYTLPGGATFNDQFHVFSLEWKQDEIKWLVDGVVFGTVAKADIGANTWPFNEQFFFLINFAVGGNFGGNPDATTIFPAWMIVDYVRVYQQ